MPMTQGTTSVRTWASRLRIATVEYYYLNLRKCPLEIVRPALQCEQRWHSRVVADQNSFAFLVAMAAELNYARMVLIHRFDKIVGSYRTGLLDLNLITIPAARIFAKIARISSSTSRMVVLSGFAVRNKNMTSSLLGLQPCR